MENDDRLNWKVKDQNKMCQVTPSAEGHRIGLHAQLYCKIEPLTSESGVSIQLVRMTLQLDGFEPRIDFSRTNWHPLRGGFLPELSLSARIDRDDRISAFSRSQSYFRTLCVHQPANGRVNGKLILSTTGRRDETPSGNLGESPPPGREEII